MFNDIIKWFDNIKLSVKLPLIVIISCLMTGSIIQINNFREFEKNYNLEVNDKISSLVESKKLDLERYLGSIEDDLNFNSVNPFLHDAVRDFTLGWKDLQSRNINPTDYLQEHYIDKNPNPIGKKEELDYANDGSSYSNAHKRYHGWMRSFLRERGYYDIFLFDMEGDLIYTVFKERDFATNIVTGKWKDTDLAEIFKKTKSLKDKDHVFFDFKPYPPSNNIPAAFVSTPIIDENGKVIGILAFQMPIDNINYIIKNTVGMGRTGEISLIGQDFLLRNDSKFSEESTILKRKVDIKSVREALSGKKGTIKDIDYDGAIVLSAYNYIDFKNVRFAFLGAIDIDEVMEPINALEIKSLIWLVIIIIIMAFIFFMISKQISTRVINLANSVNKISEGCNDEVPYAQDKDEIGIIAKSLVKINDMGIEMKKVAENALKIQAALDNASSPVIMADSQNIISYNNAAFSSMIDAVKSNISKEIPSFNNKIIGEKIGFLHKDSSKIENVNNKYFETLNIGGVILDISASPIINKSGIRLGTVLEWKDVTAERTIETEVSQIVSSVAVGDFSKKLSTENKSGFMFKLCEGINKICEVSLNSLMNIKSVLEMLSKGNLTKKIDQELYGTFNDIKTSVNNTVSELYKMISTISNSILSIDNASKEISTGSKDLAGRTEQQASNLQETSASMNELTATVKQNTQNALNANNSTQSASKIANDVELVVKDSILAMDSITDSAKKMGDIIGVIEDIAFQTNLLALNAAVEAARAGDAGKGFAVVASEVRSLAGRSAVAAKDIKSLISTSNSQVNSGNDLVKKVGEKLKEIINIIQEVNNTVGQISSASKEQLTGIEEANKAISQMDEMTQQNAALAEENTAASQMLVDQSTELSKVIKFFVTKEDK